MKHVPEIFQRGVGALAKGVAESIHVAGELPWLIGPWLVGSHDGEAQTPTPETDILPASLSHEEFKADKIDQDIFLLQLRMQEIKGYFENQPEETKRVVDTEVNAINNIVADLLNTLRSKKPGDRDQSHQDSTPISSESFAEQVNKLSDHFKKLDDYRMNTDVLEGINFQCDLTDWEKEVNKLIAAL